MSNDLGRKLLGMGDFSECMCDSADNDIISCNGQRVNLEVNVVVLSYTSE